MLRRRCLLPPTSSSRRSLLIMMMSMTNNLMMNTSSASSFRQFTSSASSASCEMETTAATNNHHQNLMMVNSDPTDTKTATTRSTSSKPFNFDTTNKKRPSTVSITVNRQSEEEANSNNNNTASHDYVVTLTLTPTSSSSQSSSSSSSFIDPKQDEFQRREFFDLCLDLVALGARVKIPSSSFQQQQQQNGTTTNDDKDTKQIASTDLPQQKEESFTPQQQQQKQLLSEDEQLLAMMEGESQEAPSIAEEQQDKMTMPTKTNNINNRDNNNSGGLLSLSFFVSSYLLHNVQKWWSLAILSKKATSIRNKWKHIGKNGLIRVSSIQSFSEHNFVVGLTTMMSNNNNSNTSSTTPTLGDTTPTTNDNNNNSNNLSSLSSSSDLFSSSSSSLSSLHTDLRSLGGGPNTKKSNLNHELWFFRHDLKELIEHWLLFGFKSFSQQQRHFKALDNRQVKLLIPATTTATSSSEENNNNNSTTANSEDCSATTTRTPVLAFRSDAFHAAASNNNNHEEQHENNQNNYLSKYPLTLSLPNMALPFLLLGGAFQNIKLLVPSSGKDKKNNNNINNSNNQDLWTEYAANNSEEHSSSDNQQHSSSSSAKHLVEKSNHSWSFPPSQAEMITSWHPWLHKMNNKFVMERKLDGDDLSSSSLAHISMTEILPSISYSMLTNSNIAIIHHQQQQPQATSTTPDNQDQEVSISSPDSQLLSSFRFDLMNVEDPATSHKVADGGDHFELAVTKMRSDSNNNNHNDGISELDVDVFDLTLSRFGGTKINNNTVENNNSDNNNNNNNKNFGVWRFSSECLLLIKSYLSNNFSTASFILLPLQSCLKVREATTADGINIIASSSSNSKNTKSNNDHHQQDSSSFSTSLVLESKYQSTDDLLLSRNPKIIRDLVALGAKLMIPDENINKSSSSSSSNAAAAKWLIPPSSVEDFLFWFHQPSLILPAKCERRRGIISSSLIVDSIRGCRNSGNGSLSVYLRSKLSVLAQRVFDEQLCAKKSTAASSFYSHHHQQRLTNNSNINNKNNNDKQEESKTACWVFDKPTSRVVFEAWSGMKTVNNNSSNKTVMTNNSDDASSKATTSSSSSSAVVSQSEIDSYFKENKEVIRINQTVSVRRNTNFCFLISAAGHNNNNSNNSKDNLLLPYWRMLLRLGGKIVVKANYNNNDNNTSTDTSSPSSSPQPSSTVVGWNCSNRRWGNFLDLAEKLSINNTNTSDGEAADTNENSISFSEAIEHHNNNNSKNNNIMIPRCDHFQFIPLINLANQVLKSSTFKFDFNQHEALPIVHSINEEAVRKLTIRDIVVIEDCCEDNNNNNQQFFSLRFKSPEELEKLFGVVRTSREVLYGSNTTTMITNESNNNNNNFTNFSTNDDDDDGDFLGGGGAGVATSHQKSLPTNTKRDDEFMPKLPWLKFASSFFFIFTRLGGKLSAVDHQHKHNNNDNKQHPFQPHYHRRKIDELQNREWIFPIAVRPLIEDEYLNCSWILQSSKEFTSTNFKNNYRKQQYNSYRN